jgi:antitoxin component YwqK of YwqJK toxin-antitoxin module
LLFLHCVEQVTEGEFKDGLLNGQGARYYSNGTVRFGTWRNGMMVRMLLH